MDAKGANVKGLAYSNILFTPISRASIARITISYRYGVCLNVIRCANVLF
jgi:hypothetical protein